MSDYTAWRITYQDAEKAARAAFDRAGELAAEVDRLEERIEWLENWCSNATAQRVLKLEADVKFWAGAAEEATLKLTARAEAAEAKVKWLEGLLDTYCGPGSSQVYAAAVRRLAEAAEKWQAKKNGANMHQAKHEKN